MKRKIKKDTEKNQRESGINDDMREPNYKESSINSHRKHHFHKIKKNENER